MCNATTMTDDKTIKDLVPEFLADVLTEHSNLCSVRDVIGDFGTKLTVNLGEFYVGSTMLDFGHTCNALGDEKGHIERAIELHTIKTNVADVKVVASTKPDGTNRSTLTVGPYTEVVELDYAKKMLREYSDSNSISKVWGPLNGFETFVSLDGFVR